MYQVDLSQGWNLFYSDGILVSSLSVSCLYAHLWARQPLKDLINIDNPVAQEEMVNLPTALASSQGSARSLVCVLIQMQYSKTCLKLTLKNTLFCVLAVRIQVI